MDRFTKTINKTIKTQKNKNGTEQMMTTTGMKEDLIRTKERKPQEEIYKTLMGGETDIIKIKEDSKPKTIDRVNEVKSVFRPSRTLSRSPMRKSYDTLADIDLTGDEEENVFSDTIEKIQKNTKIDSNEEIYNKTENMSLSGIDTTLMAIDQILSMLKKSNELVNNYLQKMTEGNSIAKTISTEMGEDLAKTRKLIKEAIKTYREEKTQHIENIKLEETKTRQLMENINKIEKRQKLVETRNEEIRNINKRKTVTPPEIEMTTKKTRTTNKEFRNKPTIRNIQILRNSEGASSESEWETIRPRRRKQEMENRNEQDRNEINTGDKTTKNRKKSSSVIKRNEAITISVTKEQTYAEATKKLKEKMGNDVKGIKRIRNTRTGDILIEFEKETDSTEFHNKAKMIMGDDTIIRRLVPKITIEILDIDPGADKDEILDSITQETGIIKENLTCKNIRKSYMGTQAAIIEGPNDIGNLLKENKIKIGWVYCRVRQLPNIIRCYKCHNFGHVASKCAVVKGDTVICRRCGDNTHTMTECKAEKAKCILCTEKGFTGMEINHIAGSLRCNQYKRLLAAGQNK